MSGQLTADQRKLLRDYVAEIERTEDEIDRLKLDVKGAYEAAGASGLDAKALKELIARRKKTPEAAEQYQLFKDKVDQYATAMATEDLRTNQRSLMIDRPFAPPLDA